MRLKLEGANREGSSWTWQRALQRTAVVLREEGVRSLWLKLLGETFYRRMILMEYPLDGPLLEATADVPVVIDLLRETDVDKYLNFRPETAPSEIYRRLKAGHLCFVARYQGRIVHADWTATKRAWIDYLSREIQLAPDEVYFYESFTASGFRGLHIASERAAHSLRYFRDARYRRIVTVVMPENTTGVLHAEKAGYRPFGVLGYVQFGPWRYDFCRVGDSVLPGAALTDLDSTYWNGVRQKFRDKALHLDAFLGKLKRQAYLDLMQRWDGLSVSGRVLKTDLFEEALGPDAFLMDLSGAERLVVGMDIAATASQVETEQTSQQVVRVSADIRRLPFANESFALIISPSTLDHFPDPRDLGRSLHELARVLQPAGRLIITLDNRQNLFDPLLRLAIRLGRVPYYIGRSYTIGELRDELEAAGFVVQETTAILHNPRLMALATVTLAKKLRWPPLRALVERALTVAQRLEKTRWRYYTGSFVAAKAVRRPSNVDKDRLSSGLLSTAGNGEER